MALPLLIGFCIICCLPAVSQAQKDLPGGIGGYPPTTSGKYGQAPDVGVLGLNQSNPYFGKMTEDSPGRGGASFDIALTDPLLASRHDGGPEQVILTQGDYEGRAFVLSWATNNDDAPSVVYVGLKADALETVYQSSAPPSRYNYADYVSPFFHHVNLTNLESGTRYFYRIGHGEASFAGSFQTPPAAGPDASMRIALIGDLGQTYASNVTLWHVQESNVSYSLFLGDMSYADSYQPRWDTWGRLVTKMTSAIPFMYTLGNHEIEYRTFLGPTAEEPGYGFKAAGYRMVAPYGFFGEDPTNMYYSFNAGAMHVIALNSYYSFSKYTPQYMWLKEDLARANKNRAKVPWIFVIVHTPIYNTYQAHFLEGEGIRNEVERLLRYAKVDGVFSGHVHAYERFNRVYQYKLDPCAPIYITLGDGGNREGAKFKYSVNPQPDYSAYREGNFGFGLMEIHNRTSATFTWHRDYHGANTPDGHVAPVLEVADSVVFRNLYYDPPKGFGSGYCGAYPSSVPDNPEKNLGTYPPGTNASFPIPSCLPKTLSTCTSCTGNIVLTGVVVALAELVIILLLLWFWRARNGDAQKTAHDLPAVMKMMTSQPANPEYEKILSPSQLTS
eukprot:TRINITY_DN14952_c0_g1_i1.p1 TRINITY_DN14952_c0_g1~~TRINITY_DN14952_c0_g1_i1.p1  ORF type:complete len:613 (+),score=75.13 TRINITY_DN14952_c0_g1_i1:45-1883(+)